jgi:serine/threonine protein kinase
MKFSQREPIFSNNYMNQTSVNEQARWNKYSLKMEVIGKSMFNLHYVIGKGGFGKVWKVDSKKSKKIYAMK